MYWIDYKISKKMSNVSDKYYLEFTKYLSTFTEATMTKAKLIKLRQVVDCLFYNLQYSLIDNVLVVTRDEADFSKPLIYNGRKVDRKVSYKYTMTLFSWLHQSGYVVNEIGYCAGWVKVDGGWKPQETKQSRLIIGEQMMKDILSVTSDKSNVAPVTNVIRVRDSSKEMTTKRLGDYQQEMCRLLQQYNKQSKTFLLESGGKEFDIQVAKIYNESSWEKGGRTYVIGGGSKVLEKDIRSLLTVNGEPTVECDYKSLHARLVATITGTSIPLDHDPYQITLDGYDSKVLRQICKLLVLCMFNADSKEKAIAAVNKELNGDFIVDENGNDVSIRQYWYENNLTPKHLELKYIADLLLQHNPFMKEHAFSGCGLELQNLDSRMMDIVVDYFTNKNEFCLPVHDSVVVRQSLKDEAIAVMYEAYSQIMGNADNCIVEVK